MRSRWPLCAFLLAALSASPLRAWPVDQRMDLEVGLERFVRLAAVDSLEVESPDIATAELLAGGELLLTGKSAGRTRLLLTAHGKVAVWQLRVAERGERPPEVPGTTGPVKAACAAVDESDGLSATVTGPACRAALLALLRSDRYLAREIAFTFELPALQAQLRDLQEALEAAGLGALRARYLGAGLVLEGKVRPQEHTKALWVAFDRTVGRLALDDRMERIEPARDAGGETP